MTLHSLLGLQGNFCSKDKEDKPLQVDFLIVDEASMVDMLLAHQLFTRLQKDTKLLLLGDVDQLESVGAGNVFAELIGSGIVPVTVLDEIFRQTKDSLIAYNAKFINEENSSLFYGPDFLFVKAENQEEAAAQIQTLYLRELQDTSIGQLQIISPYKGLDDWQLALRKNAAKGPKIITFRERYPPEKWRQRPYHGTHSIVK